VSSKLDGEAGALAAVEALVIELAGDDFLGGIMREHMATGGKRLRARLALGAMTALGGEARRAVPWAAACEIVHNATLIHDDLQDGDRRRRGEPTVWVRHGAAHAINAGDLAFMLPFVALARLDAADTVRAGLAALLAERTALVIRGQANEQELAKRSQLDWQAYERAVVGKTGALFALPVAGAALLAGRALAECLRLADPFVRLGLLFQLQDDVLDLYGDKGRDQPGSDLYEGKVSCLVVEHVALHPRDRAFLAELLVRGRDQVRPDEVRVLIERFRSGGALAAVRQRLLALATAVRQAPELRGESALAAVADELVAVVLAPIGHVIAS
jgi:geranylgeranyl diphosphate synthase, type I